MPPPSGKPVWGRPPYPNQSEALSGLIGIGAPLVAVGELTTIGVLLTQESAPKFMPWVGPALLAMCLSLAMMVGSIQYGFWAVSFRNSPENLLMWHPGATLDLGRLRLAQTILARNNALFQKIKRLAELLFRGGLLLFLLSLALLLHPPRADDADAGSLAHSVATADWRNAAQWVLVTALAIEALWMVTGAWDWLLERLSTKWDPDHERSTVRALLARARLCSWYLAKPLLPSRWDAEYPAVGRPDALEVRALFECRESPEEIKNAIDSTPQEWPRDQVAGLLKEPSTLGNRIWPEGGSGGRWELYGRGYGKQTIVTVIHPHGALQGSPTAVAARWRKVKGYFTPWSRRDADWCSRLEKHLRELAADQ
jgi:hypothetical protein